MKIRETLHNVSFKDCVSKVAATFFSVTAGEKLL